MEFKLQIRDCIELYKYYLRNTPDAPYPNATPKETLRYNRALSLGLINSNGSLNKTKGKRVVINFKKKLKLYMEGVPWEDYFLKHEKQCFALQAIIGSIKDTSWTKIVIPGEVSFLPCKGATTIPIKVFYVTNEEMIIAGKLIKNKGHSVSMRITPSENVVTDLDIKIKNTLEEWDETWIEVRPHTFCWDILKERELVWLTDRTQEIWIPVQSAYIKFALKRFSKKVVFYVRDENSFVIAKAPPTKRIVMYRKVAACIQQLESIGDFHKPDTIDAAWEGKFRDGERKLV